MKPISHKINLIKQNSHDCVQTCASMFLDYYKVKKTVAHIKKEVPVYVTKEGKKLGSSTGHIAAYFQKNFKTTMHAADIIIFDRNWNELSKDEIIERLKKRKQYVLHPIYKKDEIDLIIDGYIEFLKAGGQIKFPIITNRYIHNQLLKGPIFCIVNYQFLNSETKYNINKKNQFVCDDIKGQASTHVIIISGYKDNYYTIIDPDEDFFGKREIYKDHLLGAFYLAETDFDNLFITMSKGY